MAELAGDNGKLVGKRLLNETGTEVGVVADVDFDPADGTVLSLLMPRGKVSGDRLVGCGSYAIVVRDDAHGDR